MEYKITNKLPQQINLILEGGTFTLLPYGQKTVEKLSKQISNLASKGFIRVCKVKVKK